MNSIPAIATALVVQIMGICMLFDMAGWKWWIPISIVVLMFLMPRLVITQTINTLLWIASLGGWVVGMAKAFRIL